MISDILTDVIDAIHEYQQEMPVELATAIALHNAVTVMDALRMYFDATPSMHEEHGTIIEDLRTAIVNVDVRNVRAARDRFLQLVRELAGVEPASEPPSLDTHDDLITYWRENAEKHDDANYSFLRSLKHKSVKKVNRIALKLHQEAFNIVDCTKCANCCRTLRPVFSDEDITRIAEHQGMNRKEFIAAYLEPTDEGHRPRTMPCPFLGQDNKCTIYEVRPEKCQGYPFTDKDFLSGTIMHASNALVCPAVFYIVEQMKRRQGR